MITPQSAEIQVGLGLPDENGLVSNEEEQMATLNSVKLFHIILYIGLRSLCIYYNNQFSHNHSSVAKINSTTFATFMVAIESRG